MINEQELIYRELVAIYLETPLSGYVYRQTLNRVNELFNKLTVDDQRYNDYIFKPNSENGSIHTSTFRPQLRSGIDVLATINDFESLANIVKNNNESANGVVFHNSANANSNQSINQEIKNTLEQNINIVVNEIENNLTESQLETIKPLVDEYKKKPTRNATEKLLTGILNFGKDIAVGVIANIMSKQLGI